MIQNLYIIFNIKIKTASTRTSCDIKQRKRLWDRKTENITGEQGCRNWRTEL